MFPKTLGATWPKPYFGHFDFRIRQFAPYRFQSNSHNVWPISQFSNWPFHALSPFLILPLPGPFLSELWLLRSTIPIFQFDLSYPNPGRSSSIVFSSIFLYELKAPHFYYSLPVKAFKFQDNPGCLWNSNLFRYYGRRHVSARKVHFVLSSMLVHRLLLFSCRFSYQTLVVHHLLSQVWLTLFLHSKSDFYLKF